MINKKCPSEFAELYKYIPPNFNPGVRDYDGVDPEKHIVQYLPDPMTNFVPPAGRCGCVGSCGCGCGYRNGCECAPHNPGYEWGMSVSRDNIAKLLVWGTIIYAVWFYMIKKK